MKILTNKFFIIGNILLILIAIPITLFFVKKQQEVRSKAAPSSKLYFNPANPNTSTQCQSFTVDLMVDPGQNIVSIVDFYLTYDPTQLAITQIQPSSAFSTVVRPSSIGSGSANESVSVGADVTKAVQTISKVATITFTPKVAGTAQIQIDSSKSRVFSLAPVDQPTENVMSSAVPANANITSGACPAGTGTGGTSLSPTPATTITPTVALSPTSAVAPTIAAANQAPICTSFSVSPSSTGSAPFSVLFTAQGNDPGAGGLIAKTTFNFGDGQVQDVTQGMNLQNVTVQQNHTYQSGGTFAANVVFTDNNGLISGACSQSIVVSGSASATVTPTIAPTVAPTVVAVQPTVAPTIAPTGSFAQTVGIIGTVILTIVGGFLLLAL